MKVHGLTFKTSIDAETFGAQLVAEARRDACARHEFYRVQAKPPRWYCPHCDAGAGAGYVRAFERGLIAAGADPQTFIADYGAWP